MGRKISVLLQDDDAERFDAYCREQGFKKSTLISRLIREHMDKEKYAMQLTLLKTTKQSSER
jgi:macrodomain Ter protein organizer (MatP/YcbG family)